MNNKRGSSLIELIISIALLSVIILFMMRMILDVKNINTNATYSKDNQINRSEIITYIGDSLKDKDISKITANNIKKGNKNNGLTINFYSNNTIFLVYTMIRDDNNDYIISVEKKDVADGLRKWILTKDVSIDVNKAYVYTLYNKDSNLPLIPIIINIDIFTDNQKNSEIQNNIIDDIQISFIINKDNFDDDALNNLLNNRFLGQDS